MHVYHRTDAARDLFDLFDASDAYQVARMPEGWPWHFDVKKQGRYIHIDVTSDMAVECGRYEGHRQFRDDVLYVNELWMCAWNSDEQSILFSHRGDDGQMYTVIAADRSLYEVFPKLPREMRRRCPHCGADIDGAA